MRKNNGPAVTPPEPDLNITIIGLGLIGGSLARALKARWERVKTLTAFDCSALALEEAAAADVIDCGFRLSSTNDGRPLFDEAADPEALRRLKESDLVVVATPVEVLAPTIREVARHSKALLTDMGSVKEPIATAVGRARFIGGHPMAGSERSGFLCSSEALFENAVYVFCPDESYVAEGKQADRLSAKGKQADRLSHDLDLLAEMAVAIGALPRIMAPADHDRTVATISHLPHVIAASLVNTASAEDRAGFSSPAIAAGLSPVTSMLEMAAGGFRDITRIASSDGELWSGIVRGSRERLLPVIDEFKKALDDFRRALETDDEASLKKYFTAAAHCRDHLPGQGSGALGTDALINVELDDRPGEIAVIATMLAVRGINIKNIGIVHARQYEGGRMRLYLSNNNQVELARCILRRAGYECG